MIAFPLAQAFRITRNADHVCAEAHQLLGDREADARRRAGDEGGFVCEGPAFVHKFFSPLSPLRGERPG
jgi:hypothetical protein